ncbi:MAG TPA: ATP-binding protein [Polyangiaceae bacterium]|nr:ATP-binding protein [Polyangiaceae bacterium]
MTDSKDDRIRALEDEVSTLKLMLESAPDFITRISLDGKFLYVNRLAPGLQMDDVLGVSMDNYVPPDFRERAQQARAKACETATVQQYETIGSTGVDRVGHYLSRISPVLENGKVTSLVTIGTDVTALEENRTLLQVALDATGLGIWTMNADGGGTWDETTRRIFGAPQDAPSPNLEALMAACIHEGDRSRVSEALGAAMRTGRYGPIEHRIVRPDGELRWVSGSGTAVLDHAGKLLRMVGSVQDITHRRLLEARLLEAQKLESIGRLAGGVAHDFNNMLTAILGNVELAGQAPSTDAAAPLLTEIRVVAERSAALTAQLLAFARRQVIEPKVIDPNALIGRLNGLLRGLLGARIALTIELATCACVRVDPSQLEQVVLNLVTNARDSMPNGGKLRVETNDVELGQEEARGQLDLAPGWYVRIVVSDTGGGIAADALPHVFEPFFTTREGGTGLGLATCYGIVKQSGGDISVHSVLGQGSTFVVYLPRIEAREAEELRPVTPAPPSLSESVLLVEDEPAVRSVIERALTLAGYRVVVASTGEEGVRIANAQGPFDILITDAVMPGVNGWEVGKRLAALWPKLRILYISGYSEDTFVRGGVLESGVNFLQKPFSPPDLLRALRRLLEP